MDSIPLLIISGNEKAATMNDDTRVLGVQGYRPDIVARPFTKYATNIEKPDDALHELQTAIREALTPRCGPVWINIAQDMQREMVR